MATISIIYANIKEKFNCCDIILTEPLSYIKHLVLDNDVDDLEEKRQPSKIILLCKKVNFIYLFIQILLRSNITM